MLRSTKDEPAILCFISNTAILTGLWPECPEAAMQLTQSQSCHRVLMGKAFYRSYLWHTERQGSDSSHVVTWHTGQSGMASYSCRKSSAASGCNMQGPWLWEHDCSSMLLCSRSARAAWLKHMRTDETCTHILISGFHVYNLNISKLCVFCFCQFLCQPLL